ncbi:Uncharacterised protein [Mycobacteroides abscessus subsp. abscessus]|nr:Uncharacterised protein [Mycobacteroides abscessus subsp. abscessus]
MTTGVTRFAAVIGGLLTATAVSAAGGGVASAYDPFIGKTYSEVSGLIAQWKAKSEVATVVGDQLDRDKCIVSSYRKDPRAGKYLLSLYCDNAFATEGKPGQSAASPAGRTAKSHAAQVKFLRENPEECVRAKAAHPEWFKQPVEGCENVP